MKATFNQKEQIWQDEATRYWFDVDGVENAFAVVESGPASTIIDSEGFPVNQGNELTKLEQALIVTDAMRAA